MIDLRSDTVTKPSAGMRKAMAEAEVGDDVFREDPTALKLEQMVAEMFNKEAALFVMSGVMGNQICLNLHTQPGNEIICEYDAHIFWYESGTPALLSGIQMHPIKGIKGTLTPELIEDAVRPVDAYYMPKTTLLAVENTHNRAGGTVVKYNDLLNLKHFAQKHSLAYHCDGARIWNAHRASGVSLSDYGDLFDSLSVCLSKGLGAPIGSVVVGSKDFINEAFRLRKALGGGTRQVGVLAAAGIYALENYLQTLDTDHEHAKIIAEALTSTAVEIDLTTVQTNIIIFKSVKKSTDAVIKECFENGLVISSGKPGYCRIVTHHDIAKDDIFNAIEILKKVLG